MAAQYLASPSRRALGRRRSCGNGRRWAVCRRSWLRFVPRKFTARRFAADWWERRRARPAANAARTRALLARAGQRSATRTGMNFGSSGMTPPERVRKSRGWTLFTLSNAFPYQPSASNTPSNGCPSASGATPSPDHCLGLHARQDIEVRERVRAGDGASLPIGEPAWLRERSAQRDAGGFHSPRSSCAGWQGRRF